MLSMALASVATASWAQNAIVHGTVTDENNEPVIGATVMVQGEKTGAVTDIDGHFTLNTTAGATLSISYIGYATTQVKAADGMTIQLKENAKSLNEVVVTGYTSEKKADLTGSVAVVKMKDIADVPTGNVLQSLNGRVAGVNITTDGTPGGNNTSTLVRGTTTINKLINVIV